jgi:SAM-dependent methyltransferase
VTEYYGHAQPAARAEQRDRASAILLHPLDLGRMPRLEEALGGLFRHLGSEATGLLGEGMTSPAALLSARPTLAALQGAALFGGGAPLLGVAPDDRARLGAEIERLGPDAALDWRLSGFLVHELCHGLPVEPAGPPVPWTLLEAAALHLGHAARAAHFFPDVAGEALPAVGGFLLVGEVFARRVGRAALYRLSLGAGLGQVVGDAAAARLSEEGLALWQARRTAPFVIDALDALDWARRIEAALHAVPFAAWPELPWWSEAVSDGDLGFLDAGVAAMMSHHRFGPPLEVVPSDPPEQRLFVDPRACTLAALPRPEGIFGEPATWLFPPPAARRLLERGAERVIVEGATRKRRGEVAAALADLVASDRPLPREVVIAPRPFGGLCPLTMGTGWDIARAASLAAAHELGVFAEGGTLTQIAARTGVSPRRLRPLLDLLGEAGWLTRDDETWRVGSPPAPQVMPREGWGLLAEVLRTDRPLTVDHAHPGYQAHLREVGRSAAAELARKLPARGRVLDLGCGSGTYGTAYLPGADVWFFDRAEVLAAVEGGHRVPGDLLAGDAAYAADAELAILANLLHLHGEADCLRILSRAAASLRPGGRVAVKDFALDDDRRGPRSGIVFALNMALYSPRGDVYPRGTIAGWLAEVGLVGIERFGLLADPEAMVIVGTRP